MVLFITTLSFNSSIALEVDICYPSFTDGETERKAKSATLLVKSPCLCNDVTCVFTYLLPRLPAEITCDALLYFCILPYSTKELRKIIGHFMEGIHAKYFLIFFLTPHSAFWKHLFSRMGDYCRNVGCLVTQICSLLSLLPNRISDK